MTESPAPRPLRWETLTKKQFDAIDRREAVVLVTCSPLEVHGPHLPLGADALEGEGLAEHLLRFLPERHRRRTFIKLPFVYAATDTVPQPGSLYFRPATTIRVLEDLGRTLAAQGFRHVMVSNFHGGPRHFVAIEKACHRVYRRYGLRMTSIFSLLISRLTNGSSSLDDVLGAIPGVHKPDWVDPDYKQLPRRTADVWLAERGEAPHDGDSGRAGGLRGLIRMVRHQRRTSSYFLDDSYSGAPAGASAELGERFLDTLGEHAAVAVTELLDETIGPDDCHSPIWPLRFVFLNPWMIRLTNRMIGLRIPIV